jgi:hypothetical protein
MPKMRTAIIVHDGVPVNVIVLPPVGDDYLSDFDGVAVVPDPEDEYGTEFVTLTGCVAVEVTGMDPQPQLGCGWTYVDGQFVPPAE